MQVPATNRAVAGRMSTSRRGPDPRMRECGAGRWAFATRRERSSWSSAASPDLGARHDVLDALRRRKREEGFE